VLGGDYWTLSMCVLWPPSTLIRECAFRSHGTSAVLQLLDTNFAESVEASSWTVLCSLAGTTQSRSLFLSSSADAVQFSTPFFDPAITFATGHSTLYHVAQPLVGTLNRTLPPSESNADKYRHLAAPLFGKNNTTATSVVRCFQLR
jgi:hypothetical protein